uniref:Uncharacterized protein n=1 Tax=Panagrolaimus sp. ES5 TaxID=591445 RepID=A0AC34G8H3_9BILA
MSSDAAFDYSDEERVTIVSQKHQNNYPESSSSIGGGGAPIHSLILSEKGTTTFPLPSSTSFSQNEKYFTKEIEVNGKLMRFDSSQLKNEEGCLKISEFIVIIIALLLSGNVMGVSGERGFALFVCFIGLMIAFSIAMAKVLTLNHLLDSKLWSLLVALAVASLLFFVDACLTFYNRKFRSWSPQTKETL